MSLGSILNSARSGLLASQRAVEVASHNVANAQTEGYTRQRVETEAATPNRFPYGEFGTGVRILGTTRARDQFLDAAFRRASADASGGQLRAETLTRLEAIVGEPSATGLGAALDAFHAAWGDLAARPTADGVRGAVQQAGAQVALQLNRIATDVETLRTETRQRLQASVDEVNALAHAVADLNRQIASAEAGGQSANTLRDARDQRLDRLVALTGAEIHEEASGAVAVKLGGLALVDAAVVHPLAAVTLDGITQVTRANATGTPLQLGGEVGALQRLDARDLPDLVGGLDALARGLVDGVNAIHRQGVTWSGTPPTATAAGDFFASDPTLSAGEDPLRTARGIRLDSAIAASSAAIAASAASATGPGDGSIALQLAGLRSAALPFADADGTVLRTASSREFLQSLATDLAFQTRRATDRADVDQALATQAETRRQSVAGVSVDEELVRLIKYQQGYAAAARLVATADAMSRELLELR